ncbi:MAG TPA: hypothetical protein PLL30_10965 [Candidatus Krumholzibacteria bacterium]|nr:hypothetical protein [Candidatus Krumholzibacteria bacterium]HPD72285.1 hypothetical protein [Candidatus Krumholzibacteria bacterium]HRY40783.1 hypothetical protein [Candidatus Krumholzibacteria bacterium]
MTSPARALGALVFLVAGVAAAMAAWPGDPTVNVPLSLAPGAKSDVFAVTDGAGGAIVAWEDERSGGRDLYAQRVAADGSVLWQSDGVPVCTSAGDQALYHSSTGTTGFTPLVADPAGGAWIVWQDERAFATRARDVYVQRLDANGVPLLAANGAPVATGAGMEDQPTACLDAAGGLIVVWQDKNDDPVFANLYGQRLDGSGRPLWNGGAPVAIVVWAWDQDGPTVCADGHGGAFVAWSDSRDDVGDVYAQRVDPDGVALWTLHGVPVATGEDGQDAITITLAADGDPLLAWVDRRTGSPDIYAQKLVAATGASRWTAGGRAVCTAPESQYRPALASDAAGGAIVAWFDYRDASGPPWNLNIYAQRITTGGTAAWPANGAPVCLAPDAQRDVDLASDGAGGVFCAWEDNRAGTGLEDVYAQHVDANGQPRWTIDGAAVCTAPGNQQRPDVVAGAGGLIAAWTDDRDALYEADVYCDRVVAADPTAVAPDAAVSGGLGFDVLGAPDGSAARLALTSLRDATVDLAIYDLRGRLVRWLLSGSFQPAGRRLVGWDRRDAAGQPVSAGVYLARASDGHASVVGRVIVLR